MNNIVTKTKKTDLKFVYSENNTISIIFSKNEDLLGVSGEFNNNIKELEKITNTSIYSRGNSIILKNDYNKNEIVKNAISFLFDQYINQLFLNIHFLSSAYGEETFCQCRGKEKSHFLQDYLFSTFHRCKSFSAMHLRR